MLICFNSIMIKFTHINSFVNKVPYKAPLQKISRVNPKMRYEYSDKYFYLPRFMSKEMREARNMNSLVLKDIKRLKRVYKHFKGASPEDLTRLTDKSSEASFLKVKWVNPKDGKTYYLLNNGKTDEGNHSIRILDSHGAFVKEAVIKNKKIIIFELFSDKQIPKLNNISHAELTTLFARRYNPFAEIKLHYLDDTLKVDEEILKDFDKDTAAISCAFSSDHYISPKNLIKRWFDNFFNKRTKVSEPETLKDELAKVSKQLGDDLSGIPPHIRVFMSAGNAGKNVYNRLLSFNNIEGVGSLSSSGKIADYSASRNSYFTQHYERGEFCITKYKEGLSFTGTDDIDIPVKSDEIMIYHEPLEGTSFSVSIRAAKAVLNEMMEGVL